MMKLHRLLKALLINIHNCVHGVGATSWGGAD